VKRAAYICKGMANFAVFCSLNGNYVRWLQTHQEPWYGIRGDWHRTVAHGLEGSAPAGEWAFTVAPLAVGTIRWSAEASPGSLMGVVAARGNVQIVIEVTDRGEVYVCSDHVHSTLAGRMHVKDPRKFDVEVGHQGNSLEVSIDGSAAVKLEVPEGCRIGPAVYSGSAAFSNVEVVPFAMTTPDEAPHGTAGPASALPSKIAAVPPDTLYRQDEPRAGAAALLAAFGIVWWQRKRRALRP
jgi:hypothetical protein